MNLITADRYASRTDRRLITFITIRWAYTEQGEARINTRWTALLNAFRVWASRQGFDLAHIWVHENPPRPEPAFNTHMLASIPTDLRVAATQWLMKTLRGSGGAIDVQPRVCPGWNKPDDRVSYLCKGTDWATAKRFGLIRKHGWDFDQGIINFKRSGTSRNINATAQREFSEPLKGRRRRGFSAAAIWPDNFSTNTRVRAREEFSATPAHEAAA